MKTYQAALAALAVVSTASAARADLTHQGAVGLPLNPTAQIPAPNGARVQLDYFDLGENALVEADLLALHGAVRVGGRLELNGGVTRLSVDSILGDDSETKLDFGAKYLFTRESDAGARLAAGLGYSRVQARNTYAYLVGSKSFGRGITEGRAPVTGHLGLRWDRFKFFDSESKASIYGGLEVPLTRRGDFTFVGELQTKRIDGGSSPYSASLRFRPPGKGFSASLGVQRLGLYSRDSELFAQVGYTFGEGEGTENEGDVAVTTTTTTTTVTP